MKKIFFTKLLFVLFFGLLLVITGCPNGSTGRGGVAPDVPVINDFIAGVNVISENGRIDNLYNGAKVNVKGRTQIQVVLREGIEAEDAKIIVKLADEEISFGPFQEENDVVHSICDEVKGITTEAKEMVISVIKGKITDTRRFMFKEFDESSLSRIRLVSFMLGENDITSRIMETLSPNPIPSPHWRIYDDKSHDIKFKVVLDKDIEEAVMVVNGVPSVLQPTEADRRVVEAVIKFEDNSTKLISFVFKAQVCKDLLIPSFSMTFTHKLNAVVEVNASRAAVVLSDSQVMSGNVEFKKCTLTEPKIIVKVQKTHGELTKVTVDGASVEIDTEDANSPKEAYVATYTLAPPLEKPGDRRTVKLHFEGKDVKGVVLEATDIDITFELVQFIEAEVQIEADGKSFMPLQGGHRVYSPNVKLKVISKNDDLKDVVIKEYRDADGNMPEFDIVGREATTTLKLKDTGNKPTTFTIVLSAEGKTTTKMGISVRYTAQDDQLSVLYMDFGQGDVEPPPYAEGVRVMTRDEATLYILLGRNVKELTSMKVNGVEVMGKSLADPDQIVMEAKLTSEQGPGGKNNNAVFVFGGSRMKLEKAYTLNISLAGKDEDGHNLSEVTISPLKIKQPDFGKSNTDWRAPFSGSDAMELLIVGCKYHNAVEQAGLGGFTYNYYATQSVTFAATPKNPRAKVKGFWYKLDGSHSELLKILSDKNDENGAYRDNYFVFEEGYTSIGKSKWCATLDLESQDKKGYGIGIYLWVVSEDGTASTRGNAPDGTVKTPISKLFRRVDISCSETKIENSVGWADGWSSAIQVIDEARIDIAKVTDNKVYCRAATLGWMKFGGGAPTVECRLFNHAPQPPIADFFLVQDDWMYDNRFTVDVSSIKNGQTNEIEVEVPVYLKSLEPGKDFVANVFTRKFKIVKK